MIKLFIVDDHNALRQSLKRAISDDEQIDVVATFPDAKTAYEHIERYLPDVILMDIIMPKLTGLQMAARIKRRYKNIKIVLFTMHDNEDYVREALRIGVSGYVLKDSFLEDVISAIKAAFHDQLYLSPAVAKRVVQQPARMNLLGRKRFGADLLTAREKDILKLVAEGSRVKEIAEILNISVRTAETHRKNIMAKLDLHNVASLTHYAIKEGLAVL